MSIYKLFINNGMICEDSEHDVERFIATFGEDEWVMVSTPKNYCTNPLNQPIHKEVELRGQRFSIYSMRAKVKDMETQKTLKDILIGMGIEVIG